MKEMRFFYVPNADKLTELPMDEAMHALRVLRLKSGDEMFLMDGCGTFYRANVTIAATKRCMYEIVETLPQERAWKGKIHIAVAPTKVMDKIEWFCEKATEVGIDEITFLNCKQSERKVLRTVRLEKIIISAVKQSRKAWKPKLNPMTAFKDFVKIPFPGRKFIAHCHEEIPQKDLFNELLPLIDSSEGEQITVIIGPEGDFSMEEVNLAMDNGFESISLGKSRLRTETAALFATSIAHLALRK
ncbi:MAG: 16S rRNA (uracil(1498)-N(3))-methyltransferase [Prevotella sp.]|nr:16S rRNA (uracil(1498)-N(3))-methyltransferase [Prevotella sp.]